jgi:hypothetical protein
VSIADLFFSITVNAQNKDFEFSTRISFQSDFQKAYFNSIPPDTSKQHSATAINWGIDLLIEKNLNRKFSVYVGVGYFRNKFNFKRDYDHALLNIGTDSLPIGTRTNNYIYHLFRIPIGIECKLKEIKNYTFSVGVENIISFSFEQIYNGGKPFPDANNKYSTFQYYGNSIMIFGSVSKKISKNSFLKLIPYTRVSNIYRRKDRFIYEEKGKPYSMIFDSIGLSLEYSFN